MGILKRHYPLVRNWVNFCWGQYNQTGLVGFFGYIGDWVPPPPFGQTNMQLISATPFLRDLYRFVNMSQILKQTEDAAMYGALYNKLAAEYHSTWYNDTLKGYADSQQAANVLAMSLPGVVPSDLTTAVLGSIVNDIHNRGQWTTGIVSIAQLFPLLSNNGQHDLAVQLAQKRDYPSYGWSFTNEYENATSLWEIWNAPSSNGGMNSRNHHMFASIGAWFYRHVAGIQPNALSPIVIHPRMTADHTLLPSVSAEVVTVAGAVRVSYQRRSATTLEMEVVVPSGTQARLTLDPPLPSALCSKLIESGRQVIMTRGLSGWIRPLQFVVLPGVLEGSETATRQVELLLQSGRYSFEVEWHLPASVRIG